LINALPHRIILLLTYDGNGNMNSRREDGIVYTQDWTVENKLAKVTWTEGTTLHETSFVYDGDGNRLMRIVKTGGTLISETVSIGGIYEQEILANGTRVDTQYYAFGGKVVAVRKAGVLTYLFTDHLGSNGLASENSTANTVTGQRVLPQYTRIPQAFGPFYW
jgi:hypothetical protein